MVSPYDEIVLQYIHSVYLFQVTCHVADDHFDVQDPGKHDSSPQVTMDVDASV